MTSMRKPSVSAFQVAALERRYGDDLGAQVVESGTKPVEIIGG
jgi:hypothetical protein